MFNLDIPFPLVDLVFKATADTPVWRFQRAYEYFDVPMKAEWISGTDK